MAVQRWAPDDAKSPRRSDGRTPLTGSSRAGAYELLLDVGRGGMGTIHLARAVGAEVGALGFERLVAVKRALPATLADAESMQRFLDEARLSAHVHHANVVGIHHVGKDEAGPFIVLDYVEGDTLDALVDYASLKRRTLPPPIALRIVLDALAGLHAVHETTDSTGAPLDIVHRDVAPQNLLVGVDGVTRLADFGIAKATTSSVHTDQAYLQGRLPFLAPEYLQRQPTDRRVDVYALGVCTWFALAGRMPFSGASEAQLVLQAVHDGVPPLSSAGLSIAPAIEVIVARACDGDPAKRFPTARAMLEAIEDVGRHTGWIATHAEVAKLVAEYAGPELAARRRALAEIVKRGEVRDIDPAIASTSRPRSSVVRAVGVVALLLAVVSVLLLGLWFRGHDRKAEPMSEPAVAARKVDDASALQSATATNALEPSAPAAPSDAPSSETAAPAKSAPPSVVHRPAPGRRELPSPITTANPYR